MITLPDKHTLYEALLQRDERYEGLAFVGVTSTGIFCRLSCPARKPKAENTQFFDSVAACMDAGFRPCKRCRPLNSAAEADPIVRELLAALDEQPGYRWREDDIKTRGHDPSTVRRIFKRHFGVTFLELARLRRVRHGAQGLARGDSVIDSQIDAGFESGSGFRAAFARILGQAPADFTGNEKLKADWIETPIGAMIIVADETHLRLLEFFDRKALPGELERLRKIGLGPIGVGRFAPSDQIEAELKEYFAGKRARFDTPLKMHGSDFTQQVWRALQTIPPGETRSYKDIAEQVERPTAMRAVARANGSNQLALIIPCHRVIGADGSMTGYGGGIWRKQWLIEHELAMHRAGVR